MELQNLIIQHKDKALHIVILALALLISRNIFLSQNKKIAEVRAQVEAQNQKNDMLNNLSETEKVVAVYRNLVNKKDISAAINTISNIAADSQVKLDLIKPLPVENTSVYTRYPFSLSFGLNGYHAMGKFINRLEQHPDIYFIDKVSVKSQEDLEGKAPDLKVDLTVSTIIFKDK